MAGFLAASRAFYSDVPVLTDFARVGDPSAFRSVPGDWTLLAADIVRSRDALAEGGYKTVNMIAAAVVAAVLNAAGREELPFVFGGDGAMAAVPPELAGLTARALAGVQTMAREVAGLELRIAAIPVAHLQAGGADLRVTRLELSPGNNLAMFAGGGVELAERILKDPELVVPFAIAAKGHEAADLDGLSCRWEPLPAEHGAMATLMVQPLGGDPGALSEVLAGLNAALGFDVAGRSSGAAPARHGTLRFRFPPAGLWQETRIVGFARGRLSVLAKALAVATAFVFAKLTGLRLGNFAASAYLDDVVLNTDYRKLDDTLRLVLDLTPRQLQDLTRHLEAEQAAGRLAYGLSVSDAALMTCLVFGLDSASHIHFVDGANGGFTRAAADLKARLAAKGEGPAPDRPLTGH